MASIIGLTGGIASGKSTVAGLLRQKNIPVLDADDVVHTLYAEDTSLKAELTNAFGPSILTADKQGINRSVLAQRVLNQPEKLALLGQLVHPKVRHCLAQFARQHADEQIIALVIPLLFENNLHLGFDGVNFNTIWVCVIPETLQIERLVNLRGLTEADAMRRVKVQMPLAEKLKQINAHYSLMAIDCAATIEKTAQQIEFLLKAMLTC